MNSGEWDTLEGDRIIVDFLSQGPVRSSGVVLRRNLDAEGNMSLYLLLKGIGPIWIQAPGSARGRVRFGGGTEPLCWSVFDLYKGPKRLYLKSIDIKDDMWKLRLDPHLLLVALEWDKLIIRYTCLGIAEDNVLALFYWSMRTLCEGGDPLPLSWRFLWRWLHSRGEAPDLHSCEKCGTPLTSEVQWSETGFLCSSCYNDLRGLILSKQERLMLEAAALMDRRRFILFFSQIAGRTGFDAEFWRAQSDRLKLILDRSR